jgi:hypothetical protein
MIIQDNRKHLADSLREFAESVESGSMLPLSANVVIVWSNGYASHFDRLYTGANPLTSVGALEFAKKRLLSVISEKK